MGLPDHSLASRPQRDVWGSHQGMGHPEPDGTAGPSEAHLLPGQAGAIEVAEARDVLGGAGRRRQRGCGPTPGGGGGRGCGGGTGDVLTRVPLLHPQSAGWGPQGGCWAQRAPAFPVPHHSPSGCLCLFILFILLLLLGALAELTGRGWWGQQLRPAHRRRFHRLPQLPPFGPCGEEGCRGGGCGEGTPPPAPVCPLPTHPTALPCSARPRGACGAGASISWGSPPGWGVPCCEKGRGKARSSSPPASMVL